MQMSSPTFLTFLLTGGVPKDTAPAVVEVTSSGRMDEGTIVVFMVDGTSGAMVSGAPAALDTSASLTGSSSSNVVNSTPLVVVSPKVVSCTQSCANEHRFK
jgi:hypothetical protein